MKYLVLASILAIMQASPPVPRKAANNPTHTSGNIEQHGQSDETVSGNPPSAIETSSGGPPESNGGEQHRNDAGHTVGISKLPPVAVTKDWADWGVWAFSLLLVIVGVLQTLLLQGTLRAIQRQADLLERQINKERPRIRVELNDFQMAPIEESDGAIQCLNYTVSCYGFAHAFVKEDNFEAELRDSPDAEWPLTPNIIGISGKPDAVISPSAAPQARQEVFVTTQFEIDSVLHSKTFIHFRGRIKYRDFSEIERETTVYCVWHCYGPPKGRPRGMLAGRGNWRKAGPPEANRET